MKMNKAAKGTIAVHAIIAVVFVLLYLIIPFKKPAAAVISFVFTLLSLAASCAVCLRAIGKDDNLMSKFYGVPLMRIGLLYAAAQMAVSVVLFIICAFVAVPYWIALVLAIVLLGLAGVGCIAAEGTRDFLQEVDEKTVAMTRTISYFQIDIQELTELCKDETLREPMEKLAKKFKYSDPVSVPQTQEKEAQIKAMLEQLRQCMEEGKTDEAKDLVEKITVALNTRNRIKGNC